MCHLPSIALGGCDGGENMRAHAEGTSDEGASVWDVSLDGRENKKLKTKNLILTGAKFAKN